jgi:hypothetical protein
MKTLSESGNMNPFAEPAWYQGISSPYYDDSHRRLRTFVRDFVEQWLAPNAMEWEEAGEVPDWVTLQDHFNYEIITKS